MKQFVYIFMGLLVLTIAACSSTVKRTNLTCKITTRKAGKRLVVVRDPWAVCKTPGRCGTVNKKEPRPPRPRQSSKRYGELTVKANVRALVFVDEGFVGSTPMTLNVVPGRRLKVAVVCPRRGGQPKRIESFRIVIKGGHKKLIFATFRPACI